MPRKNKRSRAQSLRWQKVDDVPCSSSHQSVYVVPQSSEVQESAESTVLSGNQAGPSQVLSDHDKSLTDIVNRPGHSGHPGAAAPSHADFVNQRDQPSEQRVLASCSQASLKYGRSRNQQCTCNSLTFLAFLQENDDITSADLDLVLDKGNVMYNEVRIRVPNHVYLTTDELPDVVPARRFVLDADMILSRYGTFGEAPPGAADVFLDLEADLSCLLSDVQYALLMMTGLCIAVFRTRSGRYGFFDPHPRSAEGLPLSTDSVSAQTAVMLTFTCLGDVIERLKRYNILGTPSSAHYELKPVEFYNVQMIRRQAPQSLTAHLLKPNRNHQSRSAVLSRHMSLTHLLQK